MNGNRDTLHPTTQFDYVIANFGNVKNKTIQARVAYCFFSMPQNSDLMPICLKAVVKCLMELIINRLVLSVVLL